MSITEQRAQEFGIAPQREGESDFEFRHRVSGALRDQGHIIEAHEAFQNALYDQNDDVMTGIVGAMAQTLHDIDYGSHGSRQVGDDIAAGAIAQSPRDDGAAMLGLVVVLLGM